MAQEVCSCQAYSAFVAKQKFALENYLMAGNEDGWKNCDILNVSPVYPDFSLDTPQFIMDIKALETLNIKRKSSFPDSHCLIVAAEVNDARTASNLMDFGTRSIIFKRLGMVFMLGSSFTLQEVGNLTVPYIIAGQQENGDEQYLCPAVGVYKPLFQTHMCDRSNTVIEGKTVRVSLAGTYPFAFEKGDEKWDGADIRFLKLLEEKMHFKGEIVTFTTTKAAFNLVFKIMIHILFVAKHPKL